MWLFVSFLWFFFKDTSSFFFNETATTEIYTTTDTLSLHDALPISRVRGAGWGGSAGRDPRGPPGARSEEHTSELQSPVVISYAVFCSKKKKQRPRCRPRAPIPCRRRRSGSWRQA